MTGLSTRCRAALAAAALFLLMPGCLLDIRPGGMNPPGTPVDTQSDEPVVETEIDDDFIAPDPDVPDDVGPCDIVCNEGWTPACQGDTVWCVSSYRGIANCCEAFDDCQALGGAFPGFWPTAGPYDFRPQEFLEQMSLPGITIAYSGYSGPDVVASIACFDSLGAKEDGELHTVEVAADCATATCGSWTKSASCSGDPVGCGQTCTYPIWCMSY